MMPRLPTPANRSLETVDGEPLVLFRQSIRSGSLLRRGATMSAVGDSGGFKASTEDLLVLFRPKIHRGSSLHRGVSSLLQSSIDDSSRSRSMESLSKVLISHLFTAFNRCSRSRFVKNLSKMLVNPMFASFDRSSRSRFAAKSTSVELVDHSPVAVPGADPWKAGANCSLILNNSWSRSMDSWSRVIVVVLLPQRRTREMSAELVTTDRSSRNRSVENSSAELAVAVSSFLDSDFACVDYFSDIDESIAGFMDYEQNFVPGIDYAERFISQSLSTAAREDCIQWMLKVEGAKYIFEPKTIRRMEFLVLTVLDWRLRNMIQTERIFCLFIYRLIRLSALELVRKAVKMAVGTDLIKMMNPIVVNRYKRFSKAGLAAQIAAGPLSTPVNMSVFEKKNNETILVLDLGGGTFDVSVLEVGDGMFEMLSTFGDTHLGGDDFDKRTGNWLASNFKKDEGLNQINFAPMHWRKAASYGYSKLKDLEHCIMFCALMHQKMWSCWSKILKVKCLVWKVGVSLMERNAVHCQ
nr:cyclin-D1-1 isoform X2 [Ipomoea trifida]